MIRFKDEKTGRVVQAVQPGLKPTDGAKALAQFQKERAKKQEAKKAKGRK